MAGKKAGEIKKNGQPAAKPGAPAHVPTLETRKQVEGLAGLGLPHEHIAVMIGLSDDKTLREHYELELKRGKAKANAKISGTLFNEASKGNMTAAIFWMKSQGGWREKQEVVHTGPDGGPVGAEALAGAMEMFLGALFGGAKAASPKVIKADAKVIEHKAEEKADDDDSDS